MGGGNRGAGGYEAPGMPRFTIQWEINTKVKGAGDRKVVISEFEGSGDTELGRVEAAQVKVI